MGWTSTPFAGGGRGVGADHATANTIPTNLIMMKGARVLGCPVAIHTRLEPAIRYYVIIIIIIIILIIINQRPEDGDDQ